jgi:hypothetical protein
MGDDACCTISVCLHSNYESCSSTKTRIFKIKKSHYSSVGYSTIIKSYFIFHVFMYYHTPAHLLRTHNDFYIYYNIFFFFISFILNLPTNLPF